MSSIVFVTDAAVAAAFASTSDGNLWMDATVALIFAKGSAGGTALASPPPPATAPARSPTL